MGYGYNIWGGIYGGGYGGERYGRETMKRYISFSAGVNSTALLVLLTQKSKEDFETIFVNHGGYWPETYEYVSYLRKEGYEITEIIPNDVGCHTVLEYCYKRHITPGVNRRFCTDHFLLRPIRRYIEKPCIMYVGISADEKHRAHASDRKYMVNEYPLIDAGITREGCKELIRDAGLRVPMRSSCYFCPFMKKEAARRLYKVHPDLFEKVVKLEKECNRPGYFLMPNNVPFEVFAGVK